MKPRLSISGAGCMPAASSRASTKRSIGLFTQAWAFTAGGAGWVIGLNDQNSRPFSRGGETSLAGPLATTVVLRGSGAPIFTHCSSSLICSSLSLPSGGISMSLST